MTKRFEAAVVHFYIIPQRPLLRDRNDSEQSARTNRFVSTNKMLYSNGDIPLAQEVVRDQNEMHSRLKKLSINFERFYGIKPSRMDRRFIITLSDMSYLPKVSRFSVFCGLVSFSAA